MADSNLEFQLRTQALLEFYKEQCAHGRHTETQRHGVATMFLGAAGILLSVIGALRFSLYSIPLALCVVWLGLFGNRFIFRYGVKWDELSERRNHYRKEIQKVLSIPDAKAPSHPGRQTIRSYWQLTFLAIAAVGALCGLLAALAAYQRTLPCPAERESRSLRAQLAGCEAGEAPRRQG